MQSETLKSFLPGSYLHGFLLLFLLFKVFLTGFDSLELFPHVIFWVRAEV